MFRYQGYVFKVLSFGFEVLNSRLNNRVTLIMKQLYSNNININILKIILILYSRIIILFGLTKLLFDIFIIELQDGWLWILLCTSNFCHLIYHIILHIIPFTQEIVTTPPHQNNLYVLFLSFFISFFIVLFFLIILQKRVYLYNIIKMKSLFLPIDKRNMHI